MFRLESKGFDVPGRITTAVGKAPLPGCDLMKLFWVIGNVPSPQLISPGRTQ